MMPTGGFTLLIHLFINAIFFVARLVGITRTSVVLPQVALLALPLLVVLIFGAAHLVITQALAEEPTYSYFTPAAAPCPKPEPIDFERPTVVLRIDDVQAYMWRDISIRMTDDALARSMPPVLGVIPKGLSRGVALTSYLKSHRCEVEIAMHGWDHIPVEDGSGEFAYLSTGAALEHLLRGIEALARVSADVVTFIPPENEISDGTIEALPMAGLPIFSSGQGRPGDYDISTYDFVLERLETPGYVLSHCRRLFDEGAPCIIMFHPQDYAVNGELDAEKYERYLAILDGLASEGVVAARFSDLYDQLAK